MTKPPNSLEMLRFLALAAMLVAIGCKDDKAPCVQCPQGSPRPTIENIWPNADGSSWTFDYRMEESTSFTQRLYSTPDVVPDLSWDDLRELLTSHALSSPTDTTAGTYTMRFDSLITTTSGAVGQNLKVEIDVVRGRVPGVYAGSDFGALHARLWEARPDLRDALLRTYDGGKHNAGGMTDAFNGGFFGPYLIHGGAWEKTDDWIGTYGDLNQLLAWKFLGSDLSVGTEFILQLVPDLADNVFLRCRVDRMLTWRSEVGQHSRSLEVLYIIDYGISLAQDPYLNPLGYFREFDCGRVVYAPTVGPVYMYEIGLVDPGDPPSNGVRFTEMNIIDRR